MPSSVSDRILDDTVGIVQGLNPGTVPNSKVVKRMLPKAGPFDPTIDGDPPWVFVVYGFDSVAVDSEGFETVETGFPAEIAFISPNNRDFVTQLAQFGEWRGRVTNYFHDNLDMPTVPEVVDIRIMPQPFFDRGLLAQNYTMMSVPVLFVTSKQRL